MAPPADTPPADTAAERAAFYDTIRPQSLTPLWEVMAGLITPEPQSGCRPVHWSYPAVRPHVLASGAIISAEEAERRVLVLENPGLAGLSRATTSLYAGLQLVLPGEIAPAHRHAQTALRFLIEGEGGYTTVAGERVTMRPGDFVITPTWGWHDHGNLGDGPVVWLDGLDIPMIQLLDTSFAERSAEKARTPTEPPGASLARYGSAMLPDETPPGQTSPVFHYPYDRSKAAVAAAPLDACHGRRLRYVNPLTGGHAMPTMAAYLQAFDAGFETRPYRATDATVFCVAEGEGESEIGGETFRWGPGDVLVAPSWAWRRHRARTDAVVFGFSDRVVQEKLDLWREDRGNTP
ncbi:MAG: gentisate 1,2-dioxygenase [Alphaproteobacteria bacterium]|nr:gentisate 1,2-dioxygenase [Alphaproteobacteria bacterium]MCB9928965.1 gentisate 1,2-dioxygenase [Alphaproteobacteria bacterium]